ncbi:hypothetical protein [Egibacter rhizosphaerae]|uniref:hypothetical protein n=1 Tax=Egibacter rhizosphaerae TaxID=1670831 RepID=UPI0013F149A7|nr:hypothetical protein [Egibacter rhizosphaerae]
MRARSGEVPGAYAVAIAGRSFAVDVDQWQRGTLETQRQQIDVSEVPGEQSLNPRDLWRRSQHDWTHGSGQLWRDREEASPRRFDASRGVDPWERGELTLLPRAERIDSFSGTVGKAIVAAGRLYVVRGNFLSYWNGSSWSDTSSFSSTIVDVATDGERVYCATESDGIEAVTSTSDNPATINDLVADRVAFAKGRLMAAAGADVYDVSDITDPDPPDPVSALVNPDWQWDTFGEGLRFIFAAGHSGDTSMVYRWGIREDGTRLRAGAQAGRLPDGERVYAMVFYLGLVVLGTSKGVRLGVEEGEGVQIGPVVETGGPVRDLEPHGRFVWFTWSDPDNGGGPSLGRIDLTRFLPGQDLVAAWAPDLEAEGVSSGECVSVVTFDDRRVFVVEGEGVFRESTVPVGEGWVDSGRVAFGLDEEKVFWSFDVHADSLPVGATVAAEVRVDGSDDPAGRGSVSSVSDPTLRVRVGGRGEYAQSRVTLSAGGGEAPVVTRWLLRAYGVPDRSDVVQVPLNLYETVARFHGGVEHADPEREFDWLKRIERDGEPVEVQELGRHYWAVIDQIVRGPNLRLSTDGHSLEGPCVVTLRVIDDG